LPERVRPAHQTNRRLAALELLVPPELVPPELELVPLELPARQTGLEPARLAPVPVELLEEVLPEEQINRHQGAVWLARPELARVPELSGALRIRVPL
jgi:hypothetical protein